MSPESGRIPERRGSSFTRPSSDPGSARGPVPADSQDPTVIARREPVPPVDFTVPLVPRLPFPGEVVGHFRIEEFIGGGGMGRVFRATDLRLERPVALKILPPDQAADGETRARFLNEARSAAKLVHPGFALVYEAGEDNGLLYIAFEFIEGVNLRTIVEKYGPRSVPEALRIVLQVAEALAHAAKLGVVHRDIKPSNILLTNEGTTKLIDLGLARLQIPGSDRAELTASGVTLGTFDYISPEQARDPRTADQRSDIYSLGCTLFFLLTGRPPYPGTNVIEKLLQHQAEPPPDIRRLRPDVPPEVARLIMRMMAKQPQDRFQTAQELAAEVRRILNQLALLPAGKQIGPRRQVPIPRWLRRHVPWVVPVILLLLVGWLLSVLWSTRAPEDLTPAEPIPQLLPPGN
ncbi:MAG: serine/threonine protein kinase [Thermoguttaceae bacterium]|nr:serine/threonine protein kinase [Thermoguttaceae bacterium]MDW8077433.1 serine/threonine-protein kinase [Thermoguttaceae bacterium]